MYRYSIIIPHHNIPDLLAKCLNTIPEREDIQVIVVDDNSDPNIVDFDKFPGSDRSNVMTILDKSGLGAGRARNLGLEKAEGKWLFFVDSDDYLLPDCFSVLDEHANSLADIVYFSIDSIFIDTNERANRHLDYNNEIESYVNKSTSDVDKLKFSITSPWGRIIKRDIVGNIKFDEIKYSNDVMFSIQCAAKANIIEVDARPVYMLTTRYGSLTNSDNPVNTFTRFEVILRRNYFLRSINKGKYQASMMRYIIKASGYGLDSFCKMIKLMYKYKANPFIGCSNWASTMFQLKKEKVIRDKYIKK